MSVLSVTNRNTKFFKDLNLTLQENQLYLKKRKYTVVSSTEYYKISEWLLILSVMELIYQQPFIISQIKIFKLNTPSETVSSSMNSLLLFPTD